MPFPDGKTAEERRRLRIPLRPEQPPSRHGAAPCQTAPLPPQVLLQGEHLHVPETQPVDLDEDVAHQEVEPNEQLDQPQLAVLPTPADHRGAPQDVLLRPNGQRGQPAAAALLRIHLHVRRRRQRHHVPAALYRLHRAVRGARPTAVREQNGEC